MADTNDVVLAFKAEVTAGVNPGGAFDIIPWTSETLKAQGNYSQSNLVRSDGNIKDVIRNSLVPQNGFQTELGFGYVDSFMEAAYRSTFEAADTVAASTLSVAGAGPWTIDDSGNGLGVYEVFDVIHVKGFSTASNNGVYIVSSVVAGSIGVIPIETGRTPAVEAAGQSVSITTGRMANANANPSFTMEKKLVGDADYYMQFNNMRVNTMGFEAAAESPVTISFDFLGAGHDTTQASSSLNADPSDSNDPMNTDNHFVGAALGEGTDGLTSLAAATACITRISLNVNNSIRRDTAMNCTNLGKGRFVCNVDFDAFFLNFDQYQNYVDDESVSLGFAVIDGNNKGYGATFRKLRIMDAEVLAGGGDQALIANIRGQAVLDAASETSRLFKIDNSA
jgi:hypothetical protein